MIAGTQFDFSGASVDDEGEFSTYSCNGNATRLQP